MRFSRALTLLTPLLLLTFGGRAKADSTATATTFLNFGAATFSGPVAPSTGLGFGGDLTGDATITQAAGYYVPSNSFLYGGVEGVAGWGPATSSLQVGPTTFSLASAGTELTAISSITKDYSVYAAVDRLGTIFSDNGNIEINIPYTFSISMSNCGPGTGCTAVTQVFLDLSNQDGSYRTGIGASYVDQFEAVPNYSTASVLSLELTGVTPGTYNFDAGAASSAVYVPEPSSVLLLSTGLLGLIGSGMSFRKRFI